MQEKIQSIAFELFRQFTYRAKLDYPNLVEPIADETLLVNDLTKSLRSAKHSLLNEEKIESRKTEGYDYGFMLGFTWAKLNGHWFHEYIVKNTAMYKEFMILKSMHEYLKFDSLTGIRIHALYKAMLEKDLNRLDIDYTIAIENVNKFNIDELTKKDVYPKKENPVYVFLENKITKLIAKIADIEPACLVPDLERYFDNEFMNEIIDAL